MNRCIDPLRSTETRHAGNGHFTDATVAITTDDNQIRSGLPANLKQQFARVRAARVQNFRSADGSAFPAESNG